MSKIEKGNLIYYRNNAVEKDPDYYYLIRSTTTAKFLFSSFAFENGKWYIHGYDNPISVKNSEVGVISPFAKGTVANPREFIVRILSENFGGSI